MAQMVPLGTYKGGPTNKQLRGPEGSEEESENRSWIKEMMARLRLIRDPRLPAVEDLTEE